MKAVNHVNPLGTKGQVAHAFSKLVRELWGMGQSFLTPTEFRVRLLLPPHLSICTNSLNVTEIDHASGEPVRRERAAR